MKNAEYIRLKEIVIEVLKGGPGSGNFDHAGRPGEVGGSISSGSFRDLSYTDFTKNARDISGDLKKHILFTGYTHSMVFGTTVQLHLDDSISDDVVNEFANKAIENTNWKIERIFMDDVSPNLKGNSKSILWKKDYQYKGNT